MVVDVEEVRTEGGRGGGWEEGIDSVFIDNYLWRESVRERDGKEKERIILIRYSIRIKKERYRLYRLSRSSISSDIEVFSIGYFLRTNRLDVVRIELVVSYLFTIS